MAQPLVSSLWEDFATGVAGIEDATGVTHDKAAQVAAKYKAADDAASGAIDPSTQADEAAALTKQYSAAEDSQGIISRAWAMLRGQFSGPVDWLASVVKYSVWIAVVVVALAATFLYLPRKK